MATEEYQVGYEAGYQDGWNAAQQPQAEDDYKMWYEDAMRASNEAGFVGASAGETIRQLARELVALKQPDAYCITTPDGDCISTNPRCMHQPQAGAASSDHPLYVFATEVIHGAYRYTELPAKAKAAIAAAIAQQKGN